MRKVLWFLILILLVTLGGIFYWNYDRSLAEREDQPREVQLLSVETQAMVGQATLGEVDGQVKVAINFQQSLPATTSSAYLGVGVCGSAAEPLWFLQPIEDHSSLTVLPVTLVGLARQSPLVLEVFAPNDLFKHSLACGEVIFE